MRQLLAAIVLVIGLSAPALAQQSDLIPLQTRQDSQGWDAVGRLDIRGKGFCTAALIRDQLILTAAHCLYDANGEQIAAERFEFRAGFRRGRSEASRLIRRAVPHPDYVFDAGITSPGAVAVDIAVLELSHPIRTTRIRPFQTTANPITGDQVRVVSYGRGREDTPSLQDVCGVLGRQTGVIVMNCEVAFGSSGAPVFMDVGGEARIVSVVSAMAQVDGQPVSLGTSLRQPLTQLMAHLAGLGPATPNGTQRLTTDGTRNETGAKFVTP
ncbi:trypsin-like serine peptidase [Yoonia litorea]|uniref:Trypsin n=1 Tax=Yoonia litorea TaxID=1123755 RepID=A0A1I6LAA0_9RHOB|nr:trypsin-like serine protease [Yoonia litorea]SFS00334.1 Trypsin [Yoonia litorea]